MSNKAAELDYVEANKISQYLKCPICACIFKDASRGQCGHVFCKACILQWIKQEPTCPTCRKLLTADILGRDHTAEGIISELQVYCAHRSTGCRWQGCVEKYKIHIKKCQIKGQGQILDQEHQSNNTHDIGLFQRLDYSKLEALLREPLRLSFGFHIDDDDEIDKLEDNRNHAPVQQNQPLRQSPRSLSRADTLQVQNLNEPKQEQVPRQQEDTQNPGIIDRGQNENSQSRMNLLRQSQQIVDQEIVPGKQRRSR